MTVLYSGLSFFSVPLMTFPMDVTYGNILVGHFNGTLQGGVSMVTGVRGNALYIDGQAGSRVDYGSHTDGCLFDPDQCDQGISISMWLMFHESPGDFEIIFETGGCIAGGAGFCLYNTINSVVFAIRTRLHEYGNAFLKYVVSSSHLLSITFVNGKWEPIHQRLYNYPVLEQ